MPTGRRMVLSSRSGRAAGGISILDGTTGRAILDLEGHQDQVSRAEVGA